MMTLIKRESVENNTPDATVFFALRWHEENEFCPGCDAPGVAFRVPETRIFRHVQYMHVCTRLCRSANRVIQQNLFCPF